MDVELKNLREYFEDHKKCIIPEKQRVVCAAIQFPDGQIFTGVRHFSPDMVIVMRLSGYQPAQDFKEEQGFVDQWGNFLTREEAFEIAVRQGQHTDKFNRTESVPLYSEDLY